MFIKKLKLVFVSGVVSICMISGLIVPGVHVDAEHMVTYDDFEEDVELEEEEPIAEEETQVVSTLSFNGGLVAYWTFDGNYNESKSNLTTSLGAKSITYTDGVHGKAAVFNGKDNYLIVKADPILNLGNGRNEDSDNLTISAWINLGDSKYGEKYLLDKGGNYGWDKGDDFYWNNPYSVKFDTCEPTVELSNDFIDANVDPEYSTEGSSSTKGKHVEGEEWFLLTATYDGSRVKIYRDNELLAQNNYTNGITFNNDELYIGVDGQLEDYFKGAVDDLRIYGSTLSYDEVDALYQKGLAANKEFVEPTKQLVAYYAFDDDLKDESSFNNEAEKVAVGGTTKYVAGKNGNAITMSKGNYIRVSPADQLNLETEFTASFWIKVNAEGTYPILYRQNPSYSDNEDNSMTYSIYLDSWGKMYNTSVKMDTKVYNPDNWVSEDGQRLNTEFYYEENKIKSSTWFHYTCTYKDGQMKSYINGKLYNKSDKSDLINISNASGDLLIGYDGSTFMNGAIDELKIYSKCLSATDVEKEAKRIDSISLSSSDAKKVTTLSKGKSVTITSVVLKDGDTSKTKEIKLTKKNITFKTSNKKIFTVTSAGKITAVKAGKAKLTVTYGGNTKTYTITVK